MYLVLGMVGVVLAAALTYGISNGSKRYENTKDKGWVRNPQIEEVSTIRYR